MNEGKRHVLRPGDMADATSDRGSRGRADVRAVEVFRFDEGGEPRSTRGPDGPRRITFAPQTVARYRDCLGGAEVVAGQSQVVHDVSGTSDAERRRGRIDDLLEIESEEVAAFLAITPPQPIEAEPADEVTSSTPFRQ